MGEFDLLGFFERKYIRFEDCDFDKDEFWCPEILGESTRAGNLREVNFELQVYDIRGGFCGTGAERISGHLLISRYASRAHPGIECRRCLVIKV